MEHGLARGDAGVGARTLRAWPLALVVLGVLAVAAGVGILDASPVGIAEDDAMYVILAKSLATGQGYRYLNLPGLPAATHFPPGYPALLALLWRIAPSFPANLMLFKAVNALCLGAAAVAVARFARGRLESAPWALLVGALTAVSVPLWILGGMLLSEPLFVALLLLLLPALESLAARPATDGPASVRRAAVLGLAIGAAMLVRTHAIVLVPAVAIPLLSQRRWRDAAAMSAAALCCLLPWLWWSAHHGGVLPEPLLGQYDSYTAWWMRGYRALGPRMIPLTLARTLGEAGVMFGALFSPARGPLAHAVTLLGLGGLALAGIGARWRRMPVTLLFLAGYLSIVALWPFPPTRFVWGVWPLLLLVLVSGAQAVQRAAGARASAGVPRRVAMAAGAAAVLWLAAGYAAYEIRAVRGRWWASIPRDNAGRIVAAVRWTLGHTAPTDLVATADDGAVYLYTGRPTVPIRTFSVAQYLGGVTPQGEAEQGLLPVLAAYPVRVVITGTPLTLAEAQWLAAQPEPRVSLRDVFPGGASFTVLSR